MKIFMFSVDLKLAPDGEGFQILELNDGLRSGFAGYKSATGNHMLGDVIIPDYKKMFPSHDVVWAESGAREKPDSIYLPRGNQAINRYKRVDLAMPAGERQIRINDDLGFLAMCDSKTFQSAIFAGDKATSGLHPATRVFSTYFGDLDGHDWWDELPPQFVLKADNECGGNGIAILDNKDPSRQVEDILTQHGRNNKSGPAAWAGLGRPLGIVQDLLPPNLVEKDGEEYDATMRVVVTVWQDKKGGAFKCRAHDAYWKLCAAPYTGTNAREERVTYSPSYRSEPVITKPLSLFAKLDNLLKGAFSNASGARAEPDMAGPLPQPVLSHAVGDETKSRLFSRLEASLPTLFRTLSSQSLSARAAALLKSECREDRYLGVSLCTNPLYFPAGAQDKVLLTYPPKMVSALKEYIDQRYESDQGAMGYLKTMLGNGIVACENHDEVATEIVTALYGAEQNVQTREMVQMVATHMAQMVRMMK